MIDINRFPDSGAYNGWVALQQRIQAAKTAGNLTAKGSLSFIEDWKTVLTNPSLQISQESMTGYKEAFDLGYQLRARCMQIVSPCLWEILLKTGRPRLLRRRKPILCLGKPIRQPHQQVPRCPDCQSIRARLLVRVCRCLRHGRQRQLYWICECDREFIRAFGRLSCVCFRS